MFPYLTTDSIERGGEEGREKRERRTMREN